MSTLRTKSVVCSCLTLVVAAVACDAEIGEDYRGEVMLSLEGSVTTYLDLDESTTLALGFLSAEGIALVDGIVTGEFPSRFRFDVTEPPPASTLTPGSELETPADTEVAIGALRTVPREHGKTIPYLRTEGSCEWDETETYCTGTYTLCAADGRCLERTQRCWEEPCQLLAADGTPPALADGYGESALLQGYDVSYTFNISCSEGQPLASCYREYRRCDVAPSSTERASSGGVIERCEVRSETGDTELAEQEARVGGLSSNFRVIYSTRAVADLGGFPLRAGYNVVKYSGPDDEEWVAHQRCESDALIHAADEYNTAHGTSLTPSSGEPEIDDRAAELAQECPAAERYTLIEAPAAGGLEIQIGLSPSG